MKTITCLALAGLGLALSGCATVINGTEQNFAFDSDPQGAQVTLSNGAGCETPCSLELRRKYDLRADFKKDGYEPTYVLVQSRTGGAMAGNILLGGVIGGVVDASNGATNYLAPEPLAVRLAKLGSGEQAMLLGKDGAPVKAVNAHNDEVREDVAETIGAQAAGLTTTSAGGSQ
ncbi:MAG TPA: hypothetical protein VEB68_05230 [Croceibacterium sp.]|nr:hypothetical protein [Solirubrobacterales bacterium]HYD24180.1 hypothetical protein [Croceibacterium sp.]